MTKARCIGIKGASRLQNQAKIKVSYIKEGPIPLSADSGVPCSSFRHAAYRNASLLSKEETAHTRVGHCNPILRDDLVVINTWCLSEVIKLLWILTKDLDCVPLQKEDPFQNPLLDFSDLLCIIWLSRLGCVCMRISIFAFISTKGNSRLCSLGCIEKALSQ